MKKKIAVLKAQVPFMRGGAELLVENLTSELNKRGFNAEIVSVPFKWYPGNTLTDCVFAWQFIDLSESNGSKIDLVISTKFPTYVVKHENKVTWLMHQFREAYDLYDSVEYAGLSTFENGNEIRNRIIKIDNKKIPESKKIYTISKNVTHRLKKYNNIDSTPLYHPPTHIGKYKTNGYGDFILSEIGRAHV